MVSYLKAAVLACAVAIAASGSANAAQLMLTGKVIGPASDIGKTFSLIANYTPSATSAAVINNATLVVGAQTWNSLLGGSSPAITIASAKNAFTIAGQFGGSNPDDVGNTFTSLSLTVTGTPVSLAQATEANINSIFASRTTALGTLTIIGNVTGNFGGNSITLEGNLPSAVPEPGSLLVLGGLGLFVGRRMMVRRQNKAASVA